MNQWSDNLIGKKSQVFCQKLITAAECEYLGHAVKGETTKFRLFSTVNKKKRKCKYQYIAAGIHAYKYNAASNNLRIPDATSTRTTL